MSLKVAKWASIMTQVLVVRFYGVESTGSEPKNPYPKDAKSGMSRLVTEFGVLKLFIVFISKGCP